MYYTYMLRCADNSIYTGMTSDLDKRFNEHKSKSKNGAKYTKSHNAVKLEAAWKSKDKSLACKLEYQIKNLTKKQKEKLINGEKLSTYLHGKIDCRRYRKMSHLEPMSQTEPSPMRQKWYWRRNEKMPNWTKEQKQAIYEKSSNLLVAAAAGSRENCGASWKNYK